MEQQLTKQTLPSIELMYPIALASYETTLKRIEAVEKRAQEITTAAVTITAALVAFLSTQKHDFNSGWFAAAMISFAFALAVGVAIRLQGYLKLIDPKPLYDKYLDLSDEDFKERFIVTSGKHFEENADLINLKGRLTTLLSILFGLEAVFIIIHISRVV